MYDGKQIVTDAGLKAEGGNEVLLEGNAEAR
jgi:hypothetical protein